MSYRPCPTCNDTGGQTGPYPEVNCYTCGLPFMADETVYGNHLIAMIKLAYERGHNDATRAAKKRRK